MPECKIMDVPCHHLRRPARQAGRRTCGFAQTNSSEAGAAASIGSSASPIIARSVPQRPQRTKVWPEITNPAQGARRLTGKATARRPWSPPGARQVGFSPPSASHAWCVALSANESGMTSSFNLLSTICNESWDLTPPSSPGDADSSAATLPGGKRSGQLIQSKAFLRSAV